MNSAQKNPPKNPRPQPSVNPFPTPPASKGALVSVINFAARFQRFAWDAAGVGLLAFSVMTLLAIWMPELTSGLLLSWWRAVLERWLGWGCVLMVVAGTIAGLLMLRKQSRWIKPAPGGAVSLASPTVTEGFQSPIRWMHFFTLEFGAFTGLALLAALGGTSLERAEAGMDGGRIGWGLAELLRVLLASIHLTGQFWQIGIYGVLFTICLIRGLELNRPFGWLARKIQKTVQPHPALQSEPVLSVSAAVEAENESSSQKKHPILPAEFRKKFRIAPTEDKKAPTPHRDEHLPPLEILINEQGFRPDERNINLTAGLIEKSLAEFGIPAKVVGFRVGPTVTQFAVEPGFMEKTGTEEEATKQKVRVAQISSLRRDLALALSAERLRSEAPVPGRPYVGIEVPNLRTSVVRLRPLLETEAFYKIGSPLGIALGRDVSGAPVLADLASMPHLLIAGTTGSGKSVCIAALTTCLVMNNTPADLKLVMIDPKMVELVRFNGLPHLYGKVETNVERILGVLHWVVAEMDRRYKLLEEMHARDINSYNRKVSRRRGFEPLPRIVVMIDELADLMMSAPEETEHTVVRLAQMARATGIHLVVATQRPSTEVVTGLIKANFPARISFAVASSVDSRVILDTTGAESLLGRGDMLFQPPEASAPLRCQGVLVNDQEVENVIMFWQQTHPQDEASSPPWEAMLAEGEVTADKDDLVVKAIGVVRESQHASASMLQRRLRIGYPRAARMIDELEEHGDVGPAQGGGREREVIIGPQDEIPNLKKKEELDE